LPLLKLQTEIDTVLLRGLVLNLHRRADGVSNWDDLVKAEPAADTVPDNGKPAAKAPDKGPEADSQKLEQILKALAIGGIILEEANVEWRDDLNNQQFALKHFNFSTGAIRIGEAIPIDLSTELSSTVPEIMGRVSFSGGVTADPLAERYRVEGMKLTAALSGKGLPGSSLEASAGGDASVNLAAQTASIRGFTLHAMGAEVGAQVEVSKLMSQPDVEGMVKVKLKDVASLMKLAPADAIPPDLNVTAMNGTELQANLALSLGDQSLAVAPLKLNVSGLEMEVEAKGNQIIDNPSFSGKLDSNEFVPRQLLGDLGIVLPEMADPSVLGKAKLSSRFEGDLDRVALNDLDLRFDDSRFSGKASVSKFSAPVIRYKLNLDTIDVDRYLPPPEEEPVTAGEVATAEKPVAGKPTETATELPV
jgi:AsmA protein